MTALALEPIDSILARGEARGRAANLPYRGAVTPEEAWALVSAGAARLLDVRSNEELALVGRVPDADEVELKRYPDWRLNPDFLAEVQRRIAPEERVLLLCRSAVRSHEAAALLAQVGYGNCFNILQGFEGDKNSAAQRTVNGWKIAGLPWRH